MSSRLSSLRRPIWLWAALPAVVVVGLAAWAAIREIQAARRVEVKLAEFQSAKYYLPRSNAPLSNEDRREVNAWAEALAVIGDWTDMIGENLPIVGNAELERELIPDKHWAGQEEVADYLNRLAPALSELHEAVRSAPSPHLAVDESLQMGVRFFYFQKIVKASRIYQLDIEYALRSRDKQRVFDNLETLYILTHHGLHRQSEDEFQWLFLSSGEQFVRESIRRTLASGILETEDLPMLIEYVDQPESTAAWHDRVMGFARFAEESPEFREQLGGISQSLYRIPTIREAYLNHADKWASLPSDNLRRMVTRAMELENEWDSGANHAVLPDLSREAIAQIHFYASAQVRSLVIAETDRRFTRTGLALKQFQLQNGRWPEGLEELTTVGLSPTDWQTVEGDSFGYKTVAEKAYLWGQVKPRVTPQVQLIPETRPADVYSTTTKDLSVHAIEIR